MYVSVFLIVDRKSRTQNNMSWAELTPAVQECYKHLRQRCARNLRRLLQRHRCLQRTFKRLRESLGSMVRLHAERRARDRDNVLHHARGDILWPGSALYHYGQDSVLQEV